MIIMVYYLNNFFFFTIIVTSYKNCITTFFIANYMDLLLYKPCFGEMKYNFPIKRFKELSVYQDTIKVYKPLTQLIRPKEIFGYKRMR
jgi:hypothetical protein